MDEKFDTKLCQEKHRRLEEKLNTHDIRLNNHSERIDKLEQRGAAVDEKIEYLCDDIKSLISTIKWGIGITITIALFVLGYLTKIK